MTGNVNGDRSPADAERALTGEQHGQDIHPAIDPREGPAGDSDPVMSAPPLDVDEREGATVGEPADPIEMPATHEGLPGEDADFDTGFTPVGLDGQPDAVDFAAGGDESLHTFVAMNTAPSASGGEPGPDDGSDSDEDPDATPPPLSRAEAPSNDSKPIAGAASVTGAISKFNPVRFFGSREDSSNESTDQPGAEDLEPGAPLPPPGRIDRFRGILDPRLHMPDLIPHRRFTAAAILVAVLMLMANSAGLALIILGAIIPILIVMTLTQHDVFEKESNLIVAAVTVAGGVAGSLVGWLAAWIVGAQWFDAGHLNFGASGFGGRFAEDAGAAPFVIWMAVGLLLPTVAIVGIGAVPVVLRRWPQFRNEVMDGMIMAGASAAGFSIGLSVVAWFPMVNGDGPQTSVSDWTLMIAGIAILRPIIITLCGAMIGAGVWRYMMSSSSSLAIYPSVAGIVGVFLMVLGSIQLQSTGIWMEFLWTILVAIAVFVLYRRVLDDAVETDRQALGEREQRIVCPRCHQVTPAGAYCARCGQPLSESPAAEARPDEVGSGPVTD